MTEKDKWVLLLYHLKDVYDVEKIEGELYLPVGVTLPHLVGVIKEFLEASNGVINLRKSYFAFRDKLHGEGGTGYSKIELHELAKNYIFPKLVENPDNFIDGGKAQNQYSVTWLSEDGWKSYIEEFKLWAAENFNFYL